VFVVEVCVGVNEELFQVYQSNESTIIAIANARAGCIHEPMPIANGSEERSPQCFSGYSRAGNFITATLIAKRHASLHSERSAKSAPILVEMLGHFFFRTHAVAFLVVPAVELSFAQACQFRDKPLHFGRTNTTSAARTATSTSTSATCTARGCGKVVGGWVLTATGRVRRGGPWGLIVLVTFFVSVVVVITIVVVIIAVASCRLCRSCRDKPGRCWVGRRLPRLSSPYSSSSFSPTSGSEVYTSL